MLHTCQLLIIASNRKQAISSRQLVRESYKMEDEVRVYQVRDDSMWEIRPPRGEQSTGGDQVHFLFLMFFCSVVL